jgi:hypothetical protein
LGPLTVRLVVAVFGAEAEVPVAGWGSVVVAVPVASAAGVPVVPAPVDAAAADAGAAADPEEVVVVTGAVLAV